MNCKNCGSYVDENFCSHCGQKSSVGRINLANFLNEVSDSFLKINKGFFYTFKELFLRPGSSILEFLEGKRVSHFKPIAYLVTLSTLYFFISKITNQNTWLGDMIEGFMLGASEENSTVSVPKMVTWLLNNYAYSNLLLVPVFSLASFLAFFKFDKTFLEHVVLNSYATGHQAVFYILFLVAGAFIDSEVIQVLPFFLAISYAFWVFWQFFLDGNRVINLLRSVVTYVLFSIFSTSLLIALMAFNE